VLQCALELGGDYNNFNVEGTLNDKNINKTGKEYLVNWQEYDEKEASWVEAKHMANVKEIVKWFENQRQLKK